ncbi:hypothetical protein [Pseudomonas frederiksbergensis]|uniref:Uncharacterized protein n=1 Tax=Pseudomonas frederiksbergensis TaxID=104087 RepID=A0A6L5C3H3_9PSED|nr:hypothetical protein [Pseudomonas frederiksbergensis]KAF2395379.1 hypothetical protein FX983_03364 [Pseudomonas frederiksbergensis]
MRRREEFLNEAIKVHRAYEDATATLRQLLQDNKAESPEWVEGLARQRQALADWSELPLKYGDFDSED